MTRLPHGHPSRPWLRLERAAWIAGVACLLLYAIIYTAGASGAQQEVARFAARRGAGPAAEPDLRLWSPERIAAWQDTMREEGPEPLALLRIPRIGLEVAVLPGTDDWTLNRSVGHIAGTVLPGAEGNSGIAGHRDGFFRGLKDVATGDVIEIETLEGTRVYRIDSTWIVHPADVWVLDPTTARSVTLVTCYPFYFIGSAPQRFIVRAVEAARFRDAS